MTIKFTNSTHENVSGIGPLAKVRFNDAVTANVKVAFCFRLPSDAEAYKKRQIILADNALEQRLNALIEINKNYAASLKDNKIVPEIVISGNGQGQSSAMDLINLLTAKRPEI